MALPMPKFRKAFYNQKEVQDGLKKRIAQRLLSYFLLLASNAPKKRRQQEVDNARYLVGVSTKVAYPDWKNSVLDPYNTTLGHSGSVWNQFMRAKEGALRGWLERLPEDPAAPGKGLLAPKEMLPEVLEMLDSFLEIYMKEHELEAAEVDWRPDQTMAEDYSAFEASSYFSSSHWWAG